MLVPEGKVLCVFPASQNQACVGYKQTGYFHTVNIFHAAFTTAADAGIYMLTMELPCMGSSIASKSQ